MNYGISKTVDLGYDAAVEKVTARLGDEGFGVLTTIDIKKTLKNKLDVDFARYVILGACNPSFAHRALSAEPAMGMLLPCNVIVYEDAGGKTVVSAFDPEAMAGMTDNETIKAIAGEVREKLKRVIDGV